MKKIVLLLIPFVIFCLSSCESEDARIGKALNAYLSAQLPYNSGVQVSSFSPLKEDPGSRRYKTDVSFTFTEKDGGATGHGEVTALFDNSKKEVDHLILYPGRIMLDEQTPYPYTVITAETANAYSCSKRMITVRIYDRFPEEALCYLSKRLTYEYGLFATHLNISYFAEGMSLNGPNYAFCDVTTNAQSFDCKTQINPLTAQLPGMDEERAVQKAPYEGSRIVGTWQFIGPSKLVIYQKSGSYFMVIEEKGTFSAPDKLRKITYLGYTSFKYVEDTGEVFSIRPDGLYGYADGDLSCVYNPL